MDPSAEEMVVLRFDEDFVRYWSGQYLSDELSNRERRLFAEVGPSAAQRGYLASADLAEIGSWKTRRVKSYLARNDYDQIEDVTRVAFALGTPDRLRHRILCLLAGVGHPMASAVLTVWRPNEHTVLDYRSMEAFRELARRRVLEADPPEGRRGVLPDYWAYLRFYRAIAERLGVSYRDLDRALWKWNKAEMPSEVL
jgi:hypothetical protein